MAIWIGLDANEFARLGLGAGACNRGKRSRRVAVDPCRESDGQEGDNPKDAADA